MLSKLRTNAKFKEVGVSAIRGVFGHSFVARKPLTPFILKKKLPIKESTPSGVTFEGVVRAYLTLYLHGVLVVSYLLVIRSGIQESEKKTVMGSGIVASSDFTLEDILYLIDERSVRSTSQGSFSRARDFVSKLLSDEGIKSYQSFSHGGISIFVWRIANGRLYRDIREIVRKHAREIWAAYATPTDKSGSERRGIDDIRRSISKDLTVTSRSFCFLIRPKQLLILRNREEPPVHFALGMMNPLLILFNLFEVHRHSFTVFDFRIKEEVNFIRALDLNNVERRRLEDVTNRIAKMKLDVLTFLNNLFWIEGEESKESTKRTLHSYNERYGVIRTYETLSLAIRDLDSFVTNLSMKIESDSEKRTQRSLNLLTLFFGIFSVTGVASTFLLAYINTLPPTANLTESLIAAGTILVILLTLILFVLSKRVLKW